MKLLNFIPALALLLFAGFSLSSCAKEDAASTRANYRFRAW